MKVTKSDVIWNYTGTLMSLGSNLLLLPLMIYFLDGDSLGLWYVFVCVGGIASLFDFGFNPALARNIAYCWSGAPALSKNDVIFSTNDGPNIYLLKTVIVTCKYIYLIVSLVAIFSLLTAGTFYILHVSRPLAGYAHMAAWLIYIAAVFLNLYFGYYATFLRGVGAIKDINVSIVVSRAFQIIFAAVMLFLGLGLIAVSLAYLGAGLIFRITAKNAFQRYENIEIQIRNEQTVIDKKAIRRTFRLIWHNAWRDGLVSLSRYLSTQASIIIASIFLSLTATGIYSISIQLISAISTLAGALYAVYQPSLQSSHVRKDIEGSKRMMSIAMAAYVGVFWTGVLALIIIGIPLLSLIKPDMAFDTPVLMALAVYFFLLSNHSYYSSFISNTNNVPYVYAFIVSSFAGVAMSLFLVKYMEAGLWGLILGPMMVQAVYNNWIWPHKVMKSLDTNMLEMMKSGTKQIKDKLIRMS